MENLNDGTYLQIILILRDSLCYAEFRTSQALGNKFNVYIDGKAVEVDGTYTIYQACQAAGVEVPRFCYHERLSVAGNCRMCLVECEGVPKPVSYLHLL